MPNLTISFTPLSSTPLFRLLLFFGERKVTKLFALSSPSRPYPSRGGKVTDFLALTSPYSQRPLSPSRERKGTKLFRFVKPLSLSSPHSLTGRQRYGAFDIHKQRPVPSLPYPFIKDHATSHNQTLPCHHPPRLLPLLFFRERKVTKFFALSSPLTSPPRGYGKVRDFWAFASAPPLTPYPLSKTPMLLRGGNAKVRNFQLCQAPLRELELKDQSRPFGECKVTKVFALSSSPFLSRFSLGSAKVRRF